MQSERKHSRDRLPEEINIGISRAIGRPRTVLDVGCGLGLNGAVAKLVGATVVGIESDVANAARARRLLDEVLELDVLDFAAIEKALGDRKFDLLLFPEVLERVADPSALVRWFARFLEPEGHVVASLRNREAWTAKLHMLTPELGYAPAPEAKLFDRHEARAILESAGLDVLRVEHNPMLARAARPYLDESLWSSHRLSDEGSTAFTDLPVYKAYLATVRPFEVAVTDALPGLLAYQHIVVARTKPVARKLSVTIGMLTMDEEESIERMMNEIRLVAPDAQVLCIDSSMRDQTPVIAERMGARVVRQLPPRGHGPAMEVLMYEAAKQSEALIYLDCDFTYPPEVIPQIRAILESGIDVVNAARTRERPEAMPLPNYLANRTFARLGQISSGANVADLHSGMRGYRTSVIRAFSFDGEGDAIPIDTLLWPAKCGYHVVEIPLDYQERVGYSKLRKVAGTVWTFIRLAKTLTVGRRHGGFYDTWSGKA